MDTMSIAVHSAFFAEGLRSAGDGALHLAQISENYGAVDLIAAIVPYASYLEEIAEVAIAVDGIVYPGVIDYEVAEFFGKWFGNETLRLGDMPDAPCCRAWLRNETFQFFRRGAGAQEAEALEAAFSRLAA